MKLRTEPVAVLTTAAVVVGALLEADQQFHVLPTGWGHWLAYAAAALGLIIAGAKARAAVTPLAKPVDAAGTPLIPIAMARHAAPDLPGVPQGAWQPPAPPPAP